MSELSGRTVVDVRELTDEEHEQMGWYPDNLGGPLVPVLDDGMVLVPVSGTEANHAGAFHGKGWESLHDLNGAVIDTMFPMSEAYLEHLNWGNAADIRPTVIQFEDDRAIFPAQDMEGNALGCLRGLDENGDAWEYLFEVSN